MALKKYCYYSPINGASYDPIIDEVYYPKAKNELEETISILFETSHRLLTGTLLKCRMRYFISKILGLIQLLINIDGIKIAVPGLRLAEHKITEKGILVAFKLLPIFKKIFHIIYTSTIVIDETFSLLYTINALQKISSDLAKRTEQMALDRLTRTLKNEYGKQVADDFSKLFPRFKLVSQRIEDFTILIPLYAFNIDIPELPFSSKHKIGSLENWSLTQEAYSYFLHKNTNLKPLIRCYLFLSAIENNFEIGIWKWGIDKFTSYMSSRIEDFGNAFYFNRKRENCIADPIIERWDASEQNEKELKMGSYLMGKIMKYTCCASNVGLNENGQIGFRREHNAPLFVRNEDSFGATVTDKFFQSPVFGQAELCSWGQDLHLLNSLFNQMALGRGLACPFRHPQYCPLQKCTVQSALTEIWNKTIPSTKYKENWSPDPCIMS